MRTLIRFISKNAAGGVERSDKIVDVPAITIGRATDQVLQLRDRRARLQHARIEPRNGDILIVSATLAGVSVNGHSQRETKLKPGDVIEVGSNILRVIEAPEGAEFAISFELRDDAAGEHLEQSWTTPASGVFGWSKRRISWTLLIAVLILVFFLPSTALLHPSLAKLVRGSNVIPDDSFWLAGPLHTAHSSIAAECEACHVNAFQRVPDAACMACHEAGLHVAGASSPVIGEFRCASCHREHNEPAELVNRHQDLCADCHAALPDDVGLQPAEDFLDAHPDFRVSLNLPSQQESGETGWKVGHIRLADALTANRSNLSFDHKVHMAKEGLLTPNGKRVVECAECHQAEPGGAKMLPITMDEHCSHCHALSFDPDDPSRVVPHGDPAGVVQALVEYYSARLLGEDPGAVEQRVRRPGRALTREDRDRAASEARQQALLVAADLFERQACGNCHEVSRRDDSELPWHVEPVKLSNDFFPHSNFSHAAHDTEVTSCESCHDAYNSEQAEDLLIPDIDGCRECHGSGFANRNNAQQIPSACIMCHSFHYETKGVYGESMP